MQTVGAGMAGEAAPAGRRRLVLPRALRRPARILSRLDWDVPKHAGLKLAAGFLALTGVTGMVMGGHTLTVTSAVSTWCGLAIDQVEIKGQSETSEVDVLEKLALGDFPSIVTLDVTGARERIEQYDIRPPDCRLKTANFSGGNQQKIVLAREMERDPSVLLVGQPTRGVDIGAIEFIHRQLLAMRAAGKAILLVSVELDEVRALSDRFFVMCDGRFTGECDAESEEREIGLLMAGFSKAAA